jgi:SAM-dependent methyltransferase
VIGIDYDPMLLALARKQLEPYGERVTIIDVDLADPSWTHKVNDTTDTVDAVVSTTALHWLLPQQLVRVYQSAHTLLSPNGVLLNGDHFRFDHRSPAAAAWSGEHDERTQQQAFNDGTPTWDTWWAQADSDAELAALRTTREERFAGRNGTPPTGVDFQLAALTQAGFTETGTVWQLFDDYIVYAVKT